MDANYEPATQEAIRKYLLSGDRFVIAGAHKGMLATIAASVVGPEGKVFAFEPEKINYQDLCENTKDFDNIERFNFALGNVTTTSRFYFNSDNDGGHALWDVSQNTNNVLSAAAPISYLVEVKKLDDLNLGKIKMMLFDVEGAEHEVLKGAINTITDFDVPYIICEINDAALQRCGTSQTELKSFMKVYGYETYLLMPGLDHKITATKDITLDRFGDAIVFNVLFKRKP